MYIDKIGLELEGKWDYQPQVDVYSDGSVEFDDRDEDELEGEICSPPLDLPDALDFLANNYPSETNKSCGYHIHFSLKNPLLYCKLMDKRFQTYFLDELEKFGHEKQINADSQFWKRLRGENNFCLKKWIPDKQAQLKHKDSERYAQVNFCYHLENRHTVEFRVLPCFQKPTLARDALIRLYEIVETYLAKSNIREKPIIITPQRLKIGEPEQYEVSV